MNVPSDNYIAEILIKSLGSQFGGEGSHGRRWPGHAATRLAQFEISPGDRRRLRALARSNRTTPARGRPACSRGWPRPSTPKAFDASLAVVGQTGTVGSRMRGTAAQDKCHAKTGTLRDVSALAGYCTTTSGKRVAFAFMMNRVWPASARAIQDRMTSTLARYGS